MVNMEVFVIITQFITTNATLCMYGMYVCTITLNVHFGEVFLYLRVCARFC